MVVFVLRPQQLKKGTTQVVTMTAGIDYYVGPTGNDTNDGKSSSAPLKTIQKAIDLAQPGDTIHLADGVYLQDIISKYNGTASAPITIKGSSAAVVKGGGNSRIFEINHDYITLDGFTIDGLYGSSTSASGYRDKLIYAIGKTPGDGVAGLKVLNMTLKNAGGECLRLRYFARNNEIAYNAIGPCGIHDFVFNAGGKNGEGVYIGTAPEQLTDGKNPTADPDQSNNNWVHHNTFNTQGNECVDIKEASSGNVIEYNKCTGQKDLNSGGMDSRGNGNIFRNNEIYGNIGAGVRLGGDTSNDGINNDVYLNNIHDNQNGGIKFQRTPQGKICGNTMFNNTGGDSVGSYGSQFNPTVPCSGVDTTPPTVSITSPVVSGTSVKISTTASDDMAVGRVEFSIDSSLKLVDSDPPYEYIWDSTSVPNGIHSISAKAVDTSSNSSTASISVMVSNAVTPTPTPTPSPSPSPTPTPTPTPSPSPGTTFEAESGVVSGGIQVLSDSTASGGKYIKASSSGSVTYTISIPSKGDYMIAGWIEAANGSSDSFYVKIDSGSRKTWDLLDPTSTWMYDADGNPTFSLSAGTHTLTLSYREAGAKVDRLVFVKQ